MSQKYALQKAVVEDADMIFKIVNDAYDVESGDQGVSFKNTPRLDHPLEQFMLDAYNQSRIIKAVDSEGNIVGMLSYELTSEYVYFGPFAVKPEVKGTGLGKVLMNELHEIAKTNGVHCIKMNVVNWRSDLIPMYEKMGFEKTGEEPFPEPQKCTRPSLLFHYRKMLKSEIDNVVNRPQSINDANATETPVVDHVIKTAPVLRVMPPAPPSTSSSGQTKSPWCSINDMLIQNRCWLCETVFPRGKQKKVFQVSDLLDYYTARLKAEDETKSSGHVNTANDGSNAATSSVEESLGSAVESDPAEKPSHLTARLISRHLRGCYESFARIVHEDPTGEKGLLRAEYRENDIEVWMSGLVCGISHECKMDLALFIKPKASSSSTTGTAGGRPTNAFGGLLGSGKDKDGNDCPPGCGCDNPWPFMA